MKTFTYIDGAGLSFSTLCIIHCLFLPFLGTSLPILGLLSEYEWIHKSLVIMALPLALSLITTTERLGLQILATLGAITLFAAAFIPQFHDVETAMTVAGGFFLALAHTRRLMKRRHPH